MRGSTGYGCNTEHGNGGNLVGVGDGKQNHYMILGEPRTFNYFLVRVLNSYNVALRMRV